MVDVLAYNVFFIILCHFILWLGKAVHPFDSPMTFHIRHNSGIRQGLHIHSSVGFPHPAGTIVIQ